MYRSCFALLLFLFACQGIQTPEDEIIAIENTYFTRYTPSDLKKLHWLAGVWKGVEAGRPFRQSFQFHGGNALEILITGNSGDISACPFVWHDDHFYYGRYRQWVVTWIGEKDVRFDPVQPGLASMTWTRLNDQKWHLVRHTPDGDEITAMERAGEMNP